MTIFRSFIVLGLLLIACLIGWGQSGEGESILTGEDITCIVNKGLKLDGLIIEIIRICPHKIYERTMTPTSDLYSSCEIVYIFGDGEVFSQRHYTHDVVSILDEKGFSFDDAWINLNNTKGYVSRYGRWRLSDTSVREVLSKLGTYKGALLPGDGIMDHRFDEEIRIAYNGKEGWLFELISARIGDEKNIAFMDALIDMVREMEWAADVKNTPETFGPDRTKKLAEYGWQSESKIKQENIYPNIEYAWAARGIEMPTDAGEKVDYWDVARKTP